MASLKVFEKVPVEGLVEGPIKSSVEILKEPLKEELTNDQKNALEIMKKGCSIFLTGSAGTGKSYILQKYYDYAISIYGRTAVQKTSTTGISAQNIGGRTLHSWASIGLGKDPPEKILAYIRSKPERIATWLNIKVLFIDEISMLSPETFDLIEHIARKIRNDETPFGSIQLIVSGDFFQLPCVKNTRMAFQANSWDSCIKETIELKEIVRQTDPVFQKVLNEIRFGKCSDESYEILKSRMIKKKRIHKIIPTKLFSLNKDVEYVNNKELEKLISEGAEWHTFKAKYLFAYNRTRRAKKDIIEDYKTLMKQCVSDEIKLAVGTQIIFKKNIPEIGIANGTRGAVISFIEKKVPDGPTGPTGPLDKFIDNKPKNEVSTFLPVVVLLNGRELIVEPIQFEYEGPTDGYTLPSFKMKMFQLPCKLGFATSIHASQGLSLDFLEADLGSSIFEFGQTYVSLSRVRTLEGLFIKSLDRDRIMAHPEVLKKFAPELIEEYVEVDE
jgi:ATP-dependent DNA helicase PIF1